MCRLCKDKYTNNSKWVWEFTFSSAWEEGILLLTPLFLLQIYRIISVSCYISYIIQYTLFILFFISSHIPFFAAVLGLGYEVLSTLCISIPEAAVRGQRPGVTSLRIITSPHSLLLKRLSEHCDLIVMWFFSHHHWKQRCLTDTINSSISRTQLSSRITFRCISTGELLA